MLGVTQVNEIEIFFMQKKIILLNSLEGEQSAAVADFYVKGFLQMLADKIFTIAPDLHRTMILNKN
jgi:hypothetical protein